MKKNWKRALKLILPSAVLLAVTLGICCPLNMYLTNSRELWFSLEDIIIPCFFCGMIMCIIFAAIGLILPAKCKKIYTGILFGFSLCFYIQGNFINTEYGVLDGRTIDWAQYTGVSIWDALLWVVILALPVIIMIFKPVFGKKSICVGSYCLLSIQLLSVVILLISNHDSGITGESKMLTTEGLDEVSSNKNVVVFVLDTFDQEFFEEIYRNDEDYIAPLDGFTYFHNATCMYPTTIGSLPYMLTGQINRNELPIKEYIKNAYKKTDFYNMLFEDNYSIGLYTSPTYVTIDHDNPIISNYCESKPVVSSTVGLSKTLYKFAAFRFFPDVLKKYVWLYSGEFEKWKKSDFEEGKEIYMEDNVWYYDWLLSNPLKIQEKGNSYKVIHVDGPHPPFTLDENLVEVSDGNATGITESKASLKIVYEYMSQLRKLGLYDNTMIVITADHGQTAKAFTNPVLLIKPMHSNGNLKVSDAPVCHGDLQATILEEIGLDHDDELGQSMFTISESSQRRRQYLYYSWSDGSSSYLPTLAEYSIDPEGNNNSCFHFVDSEFQNYSLGERLSFQEENTASKYWSVGISRNEGVATWMMGPEAVAGFRFNTEIKNDLKIHFDYVWVFNGTQRVIVFANNSKVLDTVIYDSQEFDVSVPLETIDNGKLELRLALPDAISPLNLGISDDYRLLSFYMTGMYLEEIRVSEE